MSVVLTAMLNCEVNAVMQVRILPSLLSRQYVCNICLVSGEVVGWAEDPGVHTGEDGYTPRPAPVGACR